MWLTNNSVRFALECLSDRLSWGLCILCTGAEYGKVAGSGCFSVRCLEGYIEPMTERQSRRRPRPAVGALFALGALAQLGQSQLCDQAALISAAQSLLSKNYNPSLKGTVPSSTIGPSLVSGRCMLGFDQGGYENLCVPHASPGWRVPFRSFRPIQLSPPTRTRTST